MSEVKEAIVGVFASKTMWVAILGAVSQIVMSQVGLPEDLQLKVLALFGAKIAQQTAADFGKEKQKAVVAATEGKSPAEKAAALEAM